MNNNNETNQRVFKELALIALIGYIVVLMINQSIEMSRLKQDIENIRYEMSKTIKK